jgi:hypothetical protein
MDWIPVYRASVERLLNLFTRPCHDGPPGPVQPGGGGSLGACCGCAGNPPPHHFTLAEFGSRVRIQLNRTTQIYSAARTLALGCLRQCTWRQSGCLPHRPPPPPSHTAVDVPISQVLYPIYPDDYTKLCTRPNAPGIGGSNQALAAIVKDWMNLPHAPPANAKLRQPPRGSKQVAYPVVGRVFVEKNKRKFKAAINAEFKAVQHKALVDAVIAAGPAALLPQDLCERISVRVLTPDPSPFNAGPLRSAAFEGKSLAQALRDADPVWPLPEALSQRIGLADGQALCLAEGLTIASDPCLYRNEPLPSPSTLKSDAFVTGRGEDVCDLHTAARDFARRCAVHADSGGGGSSGTGGPGGSGESVGDGSDVDTAGNSALASSDDGEHGHGDDNASGARAGRKRSRYEAGRSDSPGAAEAHKCSICHENVIEQSIGLGCNHIFHGPCIVEWMRRGMRGEITHNNHKCPDCRAPIEAMYTLDSGGNRIKTVPVPEMTAAANDAAAHSTPLAYMGPRVHAGIARALRQLQSELHGTAPSHDRRVSRRL